MGPQLSVPDSEKNKEITLTIHGNKHTVSLNGVGAQKITPQTSLLVYLRDIAILRDTKAMCREGGCGACIVTATVPYPPFNKKKTIAVNACLVPVLACHNWEIQTTHGIGNRNAGYHPIQQSLAQHFGSQCGFCSPGMIMNMYALTESRDMLTMQEVEDSFAGNMCRCTGYRPIMDAFKSLATDADPALKNKYPLFPDIEDLKICQKTNKPCEGVCETDGNIPLYFLLEDDLHWYKARTIQNILDFFKQIGNSTYRLVAGNTGQGVYKIIDPPKYWVDIHTVAELLTYSVDKNLILGANMALTDVMELFLKLSEENDKFWYLKQVRDHLNLVANIPVRNIGTLAGNLSLKHDHHEFPSDVFLLLETLGAKVTIVLQSGQEVKKSVAEYIHFDMYKCVMKNIILKPFKKSAYLFKSYKIMPRAQNAHAHVNAGFLIEHNNYKVLSARIVYGGINPNFIHAAKTERFLVGKNIFDNLVLQGVLETLTGEIKPDNVLPDTSPEFRKNLARNLYYKFFLANAPKDKVNPKNQSGGTQLQHELLTGVQFYQTDKNQYPITEPVNKVEALIQCSGEAEYIDDIPPILGEVFGAFVLAEATPYSNVVKVDTSKAMKMPGVIDYVDYKDIPGKNLFTNPNLNPTEEKLFCEDKVEYNGQPIGVIIADTYEHAINAARKVIITYTSNSKNTPEYTIKSILEHNKQEKIKEVIKLEPKRKGKKLNVENNVSENVCMETAGGDTKKVLKGTITLNGQYHYHMETQRCICVPTEDGGYDMYSATQWMDHVQMSSARALNMTMDKFNVVVRRLGGAYGAKILRASHIAVACVVACHKIKKPIRLILPLDVNMKATGKRFPTYADYEVGVNENGVIQYLNSKFYQSAGISGGNESMVIDIPHYVVNAYIPDTWNISCNLVSTDMAGNCYARSPGASECIAFIENVMDHIAFVTGKSQVDVRKANMLNKTPDMDQVLTELVNTAEYDKRMKAVKEFNKNNRWMKKGLSLSIMDYQFILFAPYSVIVTVYSGDGSVAISHGGIEMGQGINTKVIQVCARQFQIPMNTITVKPSNTLTAPNNLMTGGSITSEGVCYATIKACKIILDRLAPIREQMGNPTWQELLQKAQAEQIELIATSMFTMKSIEEYPIPGACISEVQVDLLTGEHKIPRVDILEDTGKSISPAIDVGQIEGAFIMGLGNYTCENLVYGKEGELLTYDTWNYKIPGVKDVPEDFRISFKRDSSNPVGVLNSKATGEPALSMSIGVPFAIRQALISGKQDAEHRDDSFLDFDGPVSVEFTQLNSNSNYKEYKL